MVLSDNHEAHVVSIKNTVSTFSEGVENFAIGMDLPTTLLLTPEQTYRIAFRCLMRHRTAKSKLDSQKDPASSAFDDFAFLYSAPFHMVEEENNRYAVLNVNALQWLVSEGRFHVNYLIDEENTYDVVQLRPKARSTKPEKKGECDYDVIKTSDGEQICLRDLAKEALERSKKQNIEMKKMPERV